MTLTTVHARNLFHTFIAMYDAWAAYEPSNKTVFLGNTSETYNCTTGTKNLSNGFYVLELIGTEWVEVFKILVVK